MIDIILFNPNTFKDMANYSDAYKKSEGLLYTIINGKIVIDKGIFNGALNSRVLKK